MQFIYNLLFSSGSLLLLSSIFLSPTFLSSTFLFSIFIPLVTLFFISLFFTLLLSTFLPSTFTSSTFLPSAFLPPLFPSSVLLSPASLSSALLPFFYFLPKSYNTTILALTPITIAITYYGPYIGSSRTTKERYTRTSGGSIRGARTIG